MHARQMPLQNETLGCTPILGSTLLLLGGHSWPAPLHGSCRGTAVPAPTGTGVRRCSLIWLLRPDLSMPRAGPSWTSWRRRTLSWTCGCHSCLIWLRPALRRAKLDQLEEKNAELAEVRGRLDAVQAELEARLGATSAELRRLQLERAASQVRARLVSLSPAIFTAVISQLALHHHHELLTLAASL
jgi:hypothetical protein